MSSQSKKTTFSLIFILVVVAVAMGWNYTTQPFARWAEKKLQENQAAAIFPAVEVEQAPDLKTQVNNLISWPLVIDEKNTASTAAVVAEIANRQPQFVTLFGSNVSSSAAKSSILSLKSGSKQPWVWVDHEGGTVQRLRGEGFTVLPSWTDVCQLSASQSATLAVQISQEVAAVGVDGVLGPVLDLKASGSAEKNRTCSADPQRLLERSLQWIAAWKTVDIEPVMKHFPGIGAAKRDLHVAFDRVEVTPTQAEVYRTVLEKWPRSAVMIGHIGVVNQYPDVPCSLSPACVQQLTQSFPQTLVVSDALEMESAGFQGDDAPLLPLVDRAEKSLLAGNHVLLFGPSVTIEELDQVVAELVTRAQVNSTLKTKIENSQQAVTRYVE